MSEITVSVRNLVEFILRHGDINSAAVSSSDMALGTRIHRKLQKQEQEISDYTPEVRLFHKSSGNCRRDNQTWRRRYR